MLSSVKRLTRWVGPYKRRVNIGYLFSFFHSLFIAMPIMAAAYALNMIIEDYRGIAPLNPVWTWGMAGFMVFAVFGRFLFSYLRAVFQDSVAYERTAEERIVIGDILKRVSLGFFSKNKTGELSAAVTTDLSYFEMFSMKMMDTIVNGYIGTGVMILLILFFSPLISAIALAGVLLSALALHGMTVTSKRNTRVHQQVQDDMVSAVLEYVRGISIVKAFGFGGAARKGTADAFENHKQINIRIEKYYAFYNGLHLLALKIASTGVVLAAVASTLNGWMELSVMLMMCMFSFVLFGNVEAINSATHVMKMLDAAMDKIEQIEAAEFIDEEGRAVELSTYDIEFQNVSFSYDDWTVIEDATFRIPQGSTTAIVGPSGSGKTTLTRLIARFYDADSGSLLVGGTDVKEMNCDSLLANISMVFQQVYLFHDTVENNIRFGRADASEEDVVEAARAACCHEFIMALPDGYQTVIGDGGSTLSGGEKQRISIARAMLKNAPIIILDEATASIDPENEQLVQQAISTLVSGKTIVIIAHRMKTIQNADQILVLEDGKIAARGTHEELILEDGVYKRFWEIRQKAESWQI